MAALGVPPLLWLAARRSGRRRVNALAWPALGLLLVCLMLSYSRGALLALLVGLVFWFAAVPLRLRAAAPLVAAARRGRPVVAWAFARDALSTDEIPLAARVGRRARAGRAAPAAGRHAAGGRAGGELLRRRAPPAPRTRKIAGRVLLGGAGVRAGRALDRGSPPRRAGSRARPRTPGTQLTESRGGDAGQHAGPTDGDVLGARAVLEGGLAGLQVVEAGRRRRGRLRASRARATATDRLDVRHAHGYAIQTLADLGLIGLGLSLFARDRVDRARRRARPGCAAATAGCRSTPSGSGC